MKRIAKQILGHVPRPLPRTLSEFVEFTDEIFAVYEFPPLPSYRQTVGTMIMHLGPLEHKKSLAYFAKALKKAQANQIAYEAVQIAKKEAEEKKVEV